MSKKIIIILSIGAIVILGAGFAFLMQGGSIFGLSQNKCPRFFEPVMAAEPYYESSLFDAHLHLPTKLKAVSDVSRQMGLPTPLWDDQLSLDYLKCLFDKEGTYSAYGFHLFTKYSVTSEVNVVKEMDKKYPGMITHFIMPTMVSPTVNPEISAIEKVLRENPKLFSGIGELKMYDGKSADDPYVLKLLDLAREYRLVVMMHPFVNHKAAVEKIVKLYPDVNFLFHGLLGDEGPAGFSRHLTWLEKLIKNNKNVYYSIDAGLAIYGWLPQHEGVELSAKELMPYLKSHFASQLESDVSSYKAIIERYPDRFLRGTDKWYGSHFDKEVSSLLEEYTRAFIGRLDLDAQESFAHKNAKSLINK